jgi:hypothetical protein
MTRSNASFFKTKSFERGERRRVIVGYGLWVMGYGLWVMGYGLWVMGGGW